ncbi:hypothetical protein BC829DRAFT_419625 [Chytridium lagenaria]|nr:hypothetical protein BC829DRAFT_419625 [Chytridium lagenaria]
MSILLRRKINRGGGLGAKDPILYIRNATPSPPVHSQQYDKVLSKPVLAAERLSSLILSSKFDASKLESEFEQIKYLLDSQSLYSKLGVSSQTDRRWECFEVDLLYQIVISSLNLEQHLDSLSGLKDEFKKEWEDTGGNVQTLRAIGATLKRLESVNYLHLFGGIRTFRYGGGKADLAIAASLLYKSYVIAKVEEQNGSTPRKRGKEIWLYYYLLI